MLEPLSGKPQLRQLVDGQGTARRGNGCRRLVAEQGRKAGNLLPLVGSVEGRLANPQHAGDGPRRQARGAQGGDEPLLSLGGQVGNGQHAPVGLPVPNRRPGGVDALQLGCAQVAVQQDGNGDGRRRFMAQAPMGDVVASEGLLGLCKISSASRSSDSLARPGIEPGDAPVFAAATLGEPKVSDSHVLPRMYWVTCSSVTRTARPPTRTKASLPRALSARMVATDTRRRSATSRSVRRTVIPAPSHGWLRRIAKP